MSTTPPPRLTGDVHVAKSADRLLDDLADALINAALRAVDARGEFHLALSGGSTPEPFYEHLVIDPRYRVIPWRYAHIWQVDERIVPADDERRNMAMIRSSLTDHLPLRRRQIHPMPVMEDDPADRYEQEMRNFLKDEGRLDFVLLGMGDDAHTASLFPGSPATQVEGQWVAQNEGTNVTPPPRLTLTFETLNRAEEVAVLVKGAKKAPAIRRIERQLEEAGPDPLLLPITGVEPLRGELTWFLDPEAAGQGE
jgi:6-phosphogluconolactonase